MFDIGFGEFAVLAVLALFVFGPDRLPKVAADAVRTLRDLRTMAQNARQQLTDVVDPELKSIDVKGLDPREFVRRTLDEPSSTSGIGRSTKGGSASSSSKAASAGDTPTAAATTPPVTAWDPDAT